jgi:hypothetical protein
MIGNRDERDTDGQKAPGGSQSGWNKNQENFGRKGKPGAEDVSLDDELRLELKARNEQHRKRMKDKNGRGEMPDRE